MLTLANKREPQSIDELDAIDKAQLRICGEQWDGEDLPVEQRLYATDQVVEGNFYAQMLAHWDVLDGEARVYDAWFFMVDSGVIFRARTTEIVCTVMQFDFQSDDPALATALAEAARGAKAI